jgi:hypothetical protein
MVTLPFGYSALNISGLGTARLSLKLRIMSDDDLWWILLHHRPECRREFWREVENRKAAGILSKASPFWMVGESTPFRQAIALSGDSNPIELTREEWEARKCRKYCIHRSRSTAGQHHPTCSALQRDAPTLGSM